MRDRGASAILTACPKNVIQRTIIIVTNYKGAVLIRALTANIELFSHPYISLSVRSRNLNLPNSVGSAGPSDCKYEQLIKVFNQPN
jgi:hypothetical protein